MMAFDLSKIKNIKRIITHENCGDGTASAMILNHAFGGKVPIEFVQYGTPEWNGLKAEEGVLFCDMTPPPELADAFVEAGAIVLDHHKKAKDLGIIDKFAAEGLCQFGDEKTDPGICGATLAHLHVWEPLISEEVPGHYQANVELVRDLARLAGIYDTWQRKSPEWDVAFNQALTLKFWPWEDLKDLYPDQWETKLTLGPTLVKKLRNRVANYCENAHRFTTNKGTKVIVFDGTRDSSYVADALDKEVDLVMSFSIYCEGQTRLKMGFSTRSHTNFDCNKFCSTLNGGGHTKAAGGHHYLQPEDPNPYTLVRNLIESYEQKQAANG